MNATLAQLEAAIKVAHVVYEVIALAGANGIPSGHVYALAMNAFADVHAFDTCVGLLVKSKLVKREGNLLIATAKP